MWCLLTSRPLLFRQIAVKKSHTCTRATSLALLLAPFRLDFAEIRRLCETTVHYGRFSNTRHRGLVDGWILESGKTARRMWIASFDSETNRAKSATVIRVISMKDIQSTSGTARARGTSGRVCWRVFARGTQGATGDVVSPRIAARP